MRAHDGSLFLGLPGELRELIYQHTFSSFDNKREAGKGYQRYHFDLSLLRVNRQIYYEARSVFRRDHTFVSIETPWSEAQQHVEVDGYVPILITGDKAARFSNQHLAVVIDAPKYSSDAQEPRRFVILLEDLITFCEMWFYSDLGHLGLNSHLRLTLNLQNPYALSFEQKPIAKALQQRLLEPFGMVKGLYEVRVYGDHYESVEKAMRDAMAVPYVSPERCLEEATKLKDEGNAALRKSDFNRALRLYIESFRAMHIVCQGHRRSIWAEAYFHKEITEGTFKGQHGQIVRLILRVRLVANIVQAYLKLENFEEAHFWGMRSINLMRESITGPELSLDFPAFHERGKIYYRTGVACKALGKTLEARHLFSIAVVYLPNDSIVRKELDATTLPIG